MTITDKFIDAMWSFSRLEIPGRVLEQTKQCIVDYAACANIGADLLSRENQAFLDMLASDTGSSPVVGSHVRTTAHNAAMLNGINSHMIELDDGHRYAMLHLAAPVISAMLSAASDPRMNADRFLRGIIIGYEATIRLASAIQPGHKLRGYHATGTCGTIGSAMGIAFALGYTKEQLHAVVSAAATDAAGILQVIDEGSQLKPYNVGRAAAAALDAAVMGATGLRGPLDVLGGKRGFFTVCADEVKENYLTDGFLPNFAIEGIFRKPYAACRHCHAAIEGALNIRRDTGITPEDIRRVEVATYSLAVKGHEHTEIDGAASAKMSMPYSVAAALVCGQVNYGQYEDSCLSDSRILSLAKRVTVDEDPELSALVPAKRAAIVRIVTNSGVYENRVDYPKGEPENPITRQELEEKYFSLMAASGAEETYSRKLLNHIYEIETHFQDFLAEI